MLQFLQFNASKMKLLRRYQRTNLEPQPSRGGLTVSPPFVSRGTCSPTGSTLRKDRSVAVVAMVLLLLRRGFLLGSGGGAEGVLSDTELPAMPAESLKLSSI